MRDQRQRLHDMLESVDTILHHTRGLTESSFVEAFERDAMLADTLSYRFIVIGEASNALLGARDGDLDDLLQRYPEVDWKGYAALRNIFAHQYFRRSPTKIWRTIADELPALRQAVAQELSRLTG